MPEYLTPGVYLEETSFRARSIEGVATATFGMAGLTRYGPVPYQITFPNSQPLAMTPNPLLVTSFTEFERAFGGLGPVGQGDLNYLAYAARAFFGNGGRRVYIARVFPFTRDNNNAIDPANFAFLPVGNVALWRARWPGLAGNEFSVIVGFVRSKNVLIGGRMQGVSAGAAVELFASPGAIPTDKVSRTQLPAADQIRIVADDGRGGLGFRNPAPNGPVLPASSASAAAHITITVTVSWGDRTDVYAGLELDNVHPRAIAKVLQAKDPTDESSLVWLDLGSNQPAPADLLNALLSPPASPFLSGGSEGAAEAASDIAGEEADPDDADKAASGLEALAEIEDIAIVASPDAVRFDDAGQKTATDDLIAHCSAQKAYRIGIVDPPRDASISQIRAFRSQFDTTYAALYYPWVQIVNPTVRVDPSAGPALLDLPPCGFTAGIYARSDIDRGVHKAPANEVVLGITKFVQNVTYDRQSVLNPEGINALRFFEGRANRVWGARTMSSDPEWKYVNVRRLFNFLEHSIDRSTQWAVFEPNNERLWANIRQTIEDFLLVVWQSGALMGTRPEEAYFVRCDRSTMTQNDLDNGRLICLIGVAPTYPAEFVIFRIGQWTADTPQN
jgi:Bacteriophage tail sheath protein